jgi:hypothetical protein
MVSSRSSTCAALDKPSAEISARTRVLSTPASRAASRFAKFSGETMQSRTVPIPLAAYQPLAMRSPSICRARSSAGTNRSTRSMALSISRPLSRPAESRPITPPAGAGVSSVTPARRSA